MVLALMARNRRRELYQGAFRLKDTSSRKPATSLKRDQMDLTYLYDHVNRRKPYGKGILRDNHALLINLPSAYRKYVLQSIVGQGQSFERKHEIALNAYKSTLRLNTLDATTLNECIKQFYEVESTSGHTKATAIEGISKVLSKYSKDPLVPSSYDVKVNAKDIYGALKGIKGFLDQLDHGILHGDLDANFLASMQYDLGKYLRYVQKLAEDIESGKFSEVPKETISEIEDYARNNKELNLIAKLSSVTAQKSQREDPNLTKKVQSDTLARIFPETLLLEKTLEEAVDKALKNLLERAANNGKFGIPLNGINNNLVKNKTNLAIRQARIEKKVYEIEIEANIEMLKNLFKLDHIYETRDAGRILTKWMDNLQIELTKELNNNSAKSISKEYLSFLYCIPIDKLAGAIAFSTLKLFMRLFVFDKTKAGEEARSYDKIPFVTFMMEMGHTFERVFRLAQADYYQKASQDNFTELVKMYLRSKHVLENGDSTQKIFTPKNKGKSGEQHYMKAKKPFTLEYKAKLGGYLANIVINTLTDGNKPIMKYINQREGKHLRGYLKIREGFITKFTEVITEKGQASLTVDRMLPMVCTPAPWKDIRTGAYYTLSAPLMRAFPGFHLATNALDKSNLKPLCGILDKIGSVPWKINEPVLDVVKYLWKVGGGIAEVPPRYNARVITKDDIKKAKGEEKRRLMKANKLSKEVHGLRCEFLLRLTIAHEFSKCNEIYFPHNIDFRGRTYPLPPNLNHMGPDICRGMLIFAKKKELGPRGLYWLKVNLANHMGKDKLSLQDRVAYVDANLSWILKCGKNPYDNPQWLECESPWQALAGMMELSKALEWGPVESYPCSLPVQVDGSCNGLQHYSAIGRDNVGARKVNLADAPKPGDVYTAVLEIVKDRVINEKRPEYEKIASLVYPYLQRKTVKQPVMTSVYGVTFVGAREQIQKQLKDIPIYKDDTLLYKTASYLAKCTLEAISDIFSYSDKIRDWLKSTAQSVAKEEKPMVWESRLGFPIIQPYQKDNIKVINTGGHKIHVRIHEDKDGADTHKSKQRTAFPPNFIHSLDAAHMMLTANRCFENGIDFASVHDCYWSHPCNVDKMNTILREEFVKLHSEPLLERLKSGVENMIPYLTIEDIPERGVFNLEEVKGSTYFFS